MIIGLTGQIGAGKSVAAQILKRLGGLIIDADQIGREVVQSSTALKKKLSDAFGAEIFDKRGKLRRKKLASLAFSSETGKRTLNSLVHPYLLKELRRQLKANSRKSKLIIIDAALLLYWGMDREVDFVLVIHASRKTRLMRLKNRGIIASDALARERAQLSYREFQHGADRVILNNGTVEDLKRKLKKLLSEFN